MTVATNIPQAYAEIVEFFAAGATPESILNFQLSLCFVEDFRNRVSSEISRHPTQDS